jgi:hypothetical protein
MKIYIFGFVVMARATMTPEDLENLNDMIYMHTGLTTLAEYMDRLNKPRNVTTVEPSEDALRAQELGYIF